MTDTVTTEPLGDAIIDRAALLDRFEGDLTLVGEVAGLFLEDCPGRLDAVREALAAGDAEALESAAHSLKGSVSNFAGSAAVEAALRLETMGRDGDLTDAPAACAALEREIARLLPELIHLVQTSEPVREHAHTEH